MPVPVPCASSSWPSSSTSNSPSAHGSAVSFSSCCTISISVCLEDLSSAFLRDGPGQSRRHRPSSRGKKPRGAGPCGHCCSVARDPGWHREDGRALAMQRMIVEVSMTNVEVEYSMFVMFVGKRRMERYDYAEHLTMALLRPRTLHLTGWLQVLYPHAILRTALCYSLYWQRSPFALSSSRTGLVETAVADSLTRRWEGNWRWRGFQIERLDACLPRVVVSVAWSPMCSHTSTRPVPSTDREWWSPWGMGNKVTIIGRKCWLDGCLILSLLF